MKSYYQQLVGALATAPRSIRWTFVLVSQIPVLIMTLHVWVLALTVTHMTGASLLMVQLSQAGIDNAEVRDAVKLAFAPSTSLWIMLVVLFVSSILSLVFLSAARAAARLTVEGETA